MSVQYAYSCPRVEREKKDGNRTQLSGLIDWEPLEISIVSIPADASVGVGRSNSIEDNVMPKPNVEQETETTEVGNEPKVQTVDSKAERELTRKQELDRINAIRQMADEHDLEELGRKAIDEETSLSDFYRETLKAIGERNAKARTEEEKKTGEGIGRVGLSESEQRDFSIVRVMDAIANPNDRHAQKLAGPELEICADAEQRLGPDYNVRGVFIPSEILGGARALSAGTATDGAELVATNLLAGSFIDILRNSMATAQAGITMLPGLVGNVDIPRKTTASSATWISAEDGDATVGEPQFDQVSLSPKDLGAFTEVTRRLLMQSTPAVEGIVRTDLAQAIGLGIDLAVLDGSGSSGQTTGISATTGINVKDLAAADPTYIELVEIVRLVMEDNAIAGRPAWILEANGWEALSTTPKQGSGVEGNFILGDNGRVVGYPHFMSNQVTNEEYFFGDWSQCIVGEWGGLELNVDPYTNALKGRNRYIVFKTVDIGVRQPLAFCHAHDGIAA